ncbi:MAG: hypothetical protein IJJ77_08045 [Paludibacteraceae bacterium]|nr:hypothetical protein [Paludibacteraceae bacterium]MBR0503179.1 hypothetical protein [Paludibacteraceae bacterium]
MLGLFLAIWLFMVMRRRKF